MHEFDGDLLIGGARLRNLHGELEREEHPDGTSEWILSGRLTVSAEEQRMLSSGRQYRLELEDGRAGQVVVSKVEPHDSEQVVVEFHCPPARPK